MGHVKNRRMLRDEEKRSWRKICGQGEDEEEKKAIEERMQRNDGDVTQRLGRGGGGRRRRGFKMSSEDGNIAEDGREEKGGSGPTAGRFHAGEGEEEEE